MRQENHIASECYGSAPKGRGKGKGGKGKGKSKGKGKDKGSSRKGIGKGKGEGNGKQNVQSFVCDQLRHYAADCPTKNGAPTNQFTHDQNAG